MTIDTAALAALAALLAGGSTSAAAAPGGCAVLDQLLQKARTDFDALKDKGFGGARCRYKSHEYKCVWGFGTDKYGQAETQVDRLNRCTAAQPHAKLLGEKHGETRFQLNPETEMAIRGPDPENGHWTIQLKITTTADWD